MSRWPRNGVDQDLVLQLLENHDFTYQQIAEHVGITRERVRQIGKTRPGLLEARKAARKDFVLQRDRDEAVAKAAAMVTGTCPVCQREFQYDSRALGRQRRYDRPQCYLLWARYLRYYLSPSVKVGNALHAVRHPERVTKWQLRDGERVLREYAMTGTVLPKRRVSSNPVGALALADEIGVDLYETRDRMMKEAGMPWLPENENPT